jgi:hypothetical protein
MAAPAHNLNALEEGKLVGLEPIDASNQPTSSAFSENDIPVSENVPAASDPDGLDDSDFDPHDWALETLLNMTIDISVDNSLGLSFVSNGLLITGIAIHRDKWLALMVAQIRGAGSDGSTDALADGLDTVIGGAFTKVTEMMRRRESQGLITPVSHWVHLRDARVHASPYADYPLFRVSLDDVSAWALGSHNLSESNAT